MTHVRSTRRSPVQVARRVVALKREGLSWRKIEKRLRLNPAHGMTAFRSAHRALHPRGVYRSRGAINRALMG